LIPIDQVKEKQINHGELSIMLQTYQDLIDFYKNTDAFITAIEYTAGRSGFKDTLIEKDYLCSMVLMFLYQTYQLPLCFKGGTLLAKVHAGFYRLSEDLDFSIAIPINAKRKERSTLAKPCKLAINDISKHLPFTLSKPLTGTNESRQYNAELTYQSKVSNEKERILIEIGLREPHLIKPANHKAKTLLTDPFAGNEIVNQYEIHSLTQQEAYAEKIRAALTRQKLAIRDFYDIAYALNSKLVDLENESFIQLVKQKLSTSSSNLVKFDDAKIAFLTNRVATELQPTLSQGSDFEFDLVKVIKRLEYFHHHLKSKIEFSY
jgi:predicted nucleotidyltransferase component of viral defense system